MSTLIEDLAEQARDSAARMKAAIAAEVEQLDALLSAPALPPERRQAQTEQSVELVAAISLKAIDYAGFVWERAVAALRSLPPGRAVALLRLCVSAFEGEEEAASLALRVWEMAGRAGVRSPETVARLQAARQTAARMLGEAKGALAHRAEPWEPRHPEQYAEAMSRRGDEKPLSAEESKAYIRRKKGGGS